MRVCQPAPVAFQRSMTSTGNRSEISLRGLGERPAALVDRGSREHLAGQRRQVFILLGLNSVRVNPRQVRLQGAGQCGFFRGHWLSSC